ncbi:MAG: hypothetical protein QXU09_05330 [Thermoproteota archaeon]
MWRGLYHGHYFLGAKKDTMPRRKRVKIYFPQTFLRQFLSILILISILFLVIPIASLQDDTYNSSEPTYDELLAIFGEEDANSLTVDDAAWDALLGVMKKWTDFLTRHAYDPTQHPWLRRIQTLGKLLSIRSLAETGLILCEDEEELSAWEQVSETLNTAAWDTLEQLILIGMEAKGLDRLLLPAGEGYFIEVLKQGTGSEQEISPPSDGEPIIEPPNGEMPPGESEASHENLTVNRLYIATWLVKDPQGNVIESSDRLLEISAWIEPQALISWDGLISTPEELCSCIPYPYGCPFGEEEDDGSYFADEYRFSLMAEGGTLICATEPDWYWFFVTVYTTAYRKGQAAGYGRTIIAFTVPKDVWILGQWVREQGKIRWKIAANVLKRWVMTTSREIKPDTYWLVELHFDDGSVKQVSAPARLEIESYQPYGVECYCAPVPMTTIFLIGDISPDRSGCKATPYVADGLKVTRWLDFAAETAMGFVPCGGALVLIKRYWMGQEVGWFEWTDGVLSCFPVLGRVGGLALRGIAGASKWFLRSRQLGHLVQGSRWLDDARRLGRNLVGWISNCCGGEYHHLWPIYLGGDRNAPVVRMQRDLHRKFH